MMPWNRKELWMGISQQKFSEIRKLLSDHKIAYDYNVKSTNWSGGRGMHEGNMVSPSRFGETQESANSYYIYVRKDTYEKAAGLLHEFL